MGAVIVTRQTRCTGLPGTISSPEQATRTTSGSLTVGAPNGCRDLRGAASCGSVLLHTGGRAPSGHATRGGAPAATRHTTQGTSAGPVDTESRRVWSPAGGSAAGASRGIGGEPYRGRLVAMPVPSAVI